jgi:ABC-type spermidine/putrescine transport system permease subunit I
MTDNYRDILERTLWTFAQAFLATFAVSDLSTLKSAAIAGVAAALAVVKGAAKAKVGK